MLSMRSTLRTIGHWDVDNSRWVALTFLSAAAFLCLPRMFQVLVVENEDEDHLRTASWAFPIYLLLISLFVAPIAVVGLNIMPENSNPDFFVLSIPLAMGRDNLAIFFFGRFFSNFHGDRCIAGSGNNGFKSHSYASFS